MKGLLTALLVSMVLVASPVLAADFESVAFSQQLSFKTLWDLASWLLDWDSTDKSGGMIIPESGSTETEESDFRTGQTTADNDSGGMIIPNE